MSANPRDMLPRDKHDTDRARAIVELGYPAVRSVLPELLGWLKDINWPVAKVLQPFLAKIGAPLASEVRNVLSSNDGLWKLWVISEVVAQSRELAAELLADLARLAERPTNDEKTEEVDVVARDVLTQLGQS